MKRWCLGFPFCREEIPEDDVACKRCWARVPRRLRYEVLATKRRWPGTKLASDTLARAEKILHDRLLVRKQQAENRKLFTVVG